MLKMSPIKVSFITIVIIICFNSTQTLLASNKIIMTGNISFVCAFFRAKDYSIDDISMPEILTFCSCTIIHSQWAVTAKLCFVQLDWYISPINKTFTSKLPENLHNIERIIDRHDLTFVKFKPKFNGAVAEISESKLGRTKICDLYGFSPPNNEPVKGNHNNLIYKIWHMEGDLLKTKVKALDHTTCKNKHNGALSEYKKINERTLCLNSLTNQYVEPCSFDRGAPIICDNKLQGVLIYERPLPKGIPLHLPTGCYGNIDSSLSIYSEEITSYFNWINVRIK